MNVIPFGHHSQETQGPPFGVSHKAEAPAMCSSSFQGDTGIEWAGKNGRGGAHRLLPSPSRSPVSHEVCALLEWPVSQPAALKVCH